ncbi:MAG: tetratricopeptide repeat protein [bacterium]
MCDTGKIFFICFFIIMHSAVYAGEGTGAAIFAQPIGVRASGMGEAYTSVGDDVSSLYYNPACLARLSRKEASFLYQSGVIGDTFGSFNLGLPFEQGVAAVSYFNYTTGNLDLIDSGGVHRSIKAEEDYGITLSAGCSPWDGADIGLNLKMLNSTLAGEFTASARAFDIGGVYHVIEDSLFFGLSAQNIGGKLTYDAETEPLPTIIRSGISHNSEYSLISFDIVKPGDGGMEKCLGVEYSLMENLALRCGYRDMGDTNEISAGFGVTLSDMKIDYAWSPDADLGDCHRFSLSTRWKSKVTTGRGEPDLSGPWRLFVNARELFRLGRYNAAQKKFKEVLKSVPSHEESKKCIIFCQRNFYESLEPEAQQRYIDRCFMKGVDMLKRKKYDKAIECFEEVYNLNPKYPQVKDYLQWTRDKLEKYPFTK